MKQSLDDFYKKHPMEICDLKRQYGTMSFDEHSKMVSYTYEANLPNIEEQELETLFEYIDVFHFFLNIGLCLGIDGELFKALYKAKNKENFERQKRGY